MSARAATLALVALLLAPEAAAAAKKAEPKLGDLDRAFALSADGEARIDAQVKGLVVESVAAKDLPTEKEVAQARKDPGDESHPKFTVAISNPGKVRKKVRVEVRLESADNRVLMSCSRKDSVEAGARGTGVGLCWLESLRTADWPKVVRARLIVSVVKD